ncbi:hypothetical protein N9214_01375 [bacterium]|nr:hypothetical protein [bacterium]
MTFLFDIGNVLLNLHFERFHDSVLPAHLEYGGLFESVRRHIAEHKLSLKPRLERWNDLFLELKGIEQEI